MPWFIGSDQTLSVSGLRDPITGLYVNTATVRATMYDALGVQVAGQTWPLVLSYATASNGNYSGILEDGRVLKDSFLYWIEIEADAGSDLIKKWRWSDVARHRIPADDA